MIELIEAISVPRASFCMTSRWITTPSCTPMAGLIRLLFSGCPGHKVLQGWKCSISVYQYLTITRAGTQTRCAARLRPTVRTGLRRAATVNACWNRKPLAATPSSRTDNPMAGTNCTAETSYTGIFVDYAAEDYHVKPRVHAV